MLDKKDELTEKQKDMYIAIVVYIEQNGFPPSMRELQVALRLKSHSTVEARVLALVKKGWISWEKDKTRAIRLLKEKFHLERITDVAKTHKITISNEPIQKAKRIFTFKD